MTTFFSYITQHKIPSRQTLNALCTPPLTWYGFILYGLLASIIVVFYILLIAINARFLVPIPARGGTITEGVIGAPRFINPIIATTETDVALTNLLFAGLMRKETTDGTVVPELAQSYTLSPDGLTYTFVLRDKLKWSDRKPLTSTDVAFTIATLADPLLNPSTSTYWQGATVTTLSPTTVSISFGEPRPDFLSRATIGIIPEHIWSAVPAESFTDAPTNLKPIGSGMYTFRALTTENNIPVAIELRRNKNYALGKTYVATYRVAFFANQNDLLEALNSGSIDMTIAATSKTATQVTNDDLSIEKIASRYNVALFRQRSEPILGNQKFVQILYRAVDKNAILATVENGYGILPSTPTSHTDTPASTDDVFNELKSLGYTYTDGTLSKDGAPVGFAIAVENDELVLRTAQTLAQALAQFGIVVTVKAFDPGIFQDRLRSSQYPIVLAREYDVDIPQTYEPVLALYSNAYPFITKSSLHVSIPRYLPAMSDRYIEALDWHTTVDTVWKIFSRTTINNKQ